MGLEPAVWQSAFVESVGKSVFPEGVPEELNNAFPRAFPGYVYSEEHEVKEYEFLGRYHCMRVGLPRSRYDNCLNPLIPPMGRCVAC